MLFDLLINLLNYLVSGCIVLWLLIDGKTIKGSDESFMALAGAPTWCRVFQVALLWPLVLAHVLLVRWPLPKRETVYRTVHVRKRESEHYELERATRFLGRCYGWQVVLSHDGKVKITRKFNNWSSAIEAARQLNEKELNQRFKAIRRTGPAFRGSI